MENVIKTKVGCQPIARKGEHTASVKSRFVFISYSSNLYRLKCGEIHKEKIFVCPMSDCQKRYANKCGLVEHLKRQVILSFTMITLLFVV